MLLILSGVFHLAILSRMCESSRMYTVYTYTPTYCIYHSDLTQQYREDFCFPYLHGSSRDSRKKKAGYKNDTERDEARRHDRERDGAKMIERIKSMTRPKYD